MKHNNVLFLNSLTMMIHIMFFTSAISVYFQNNNTGKYSSIVVIISSISQIVVLSPKLEKIIMGLTATNTRLIQIFIVSDIIFITAMIVSYINGWFILYFIASPICFGLITSVGNKMYHRKLNNILSGDKLFLYNYKIQRWNNYGMLAGSILSYVIVTNIPYYDNMHFMNMGLFSLGITIESVTDVLLLDVAKTL